MIGTITYRVTGGDHCFHPHYPSDDAAIYISDVPFEEAKERYKAVCRPNDRAVDKGLPPDPVETVCGDYLDEIAAKLA